MERLTGVGVSPGVAVGRAVILIQRARALRYQIAAARVPDEVERLEQSRARSREQLHDIRARVSTRRGPELAALFDAQLLMLEDPMLVPRAVSAVREQLLNAEWAVQQVFDECSRVFEDIADPYLRERRGDVGDVAGRLIMNLGHGTSAPRDLLNAIEESSVLIADELTPSLAAQVDWTKVRGFATDVGSRTYHTAILARSLEVPAVVGLHEASTRVRPGQLVLIDGAQGELIIDPDDELLARIAADAVTPRSEGTAADSGPPVAARTADGVEVRLDANLEFPEDLAAASRAGAQGIGLFRSEFLLTEGHGVPDEGEQYEIYRRMLEGMLPERVTVRTFDLDEEDIAAAAEATASRVAWAAHDQRGSRQGLRGLRLSLTHQGLFRTQLRALLRASSHGLLRIMFPFVSGVEQVRAAKRIVADVAAELAAEGHIIPEVPIGVMVEIPAAAVTADLLAREVDFLTIGTNDLIQYCLAVDRTDDRVSRLYEPLDPAILRVIRMVQRAAARRRVPVSLCGEMAADPALLALLVGLGLREFSMAPGAIGMVRQVVSGVRCDDMRALARRVLRLSTVDEIDEELLAGVGRYRAGRKGVMS